MSSAEPITAAEQRNTLGNFSPKTAVAGLIPLLKLREEGVHISRGYLLLIRAPTIC